ncbi:MAG: DUF4430 domain-containing protein [Oscillospiraceae bacterium]|nr:DUF4430 domain-containing protein [Oscillospiraceae bacterium]
MKKLIAIVMALILTFSLFACSGKKSDDSEKIYTCTVSISCTVLLEEENYNNLTPEKQQMVPEDGIILAPMEVKFAEGDSAFDILQQVTRDNKIHLEFSESPLYESAYIEGINNLYELDCGDLSGWMIRINGEFPNYGSSNCFFEDGATVEWMYTCDLGQDVGDTID